MRSDQGEALIVDRLVQGGALDARKKIKKVNSPGLRPHIFLPRSKTGRTIILDCYATFGNATFGNATFGEEMWNTMCNLEFREAGS